METGSTYKVPLNMVYAERIYNGEMDFDTKIAGARYDFLQYITIVRSNNEYATYLWKELGEYGVFRNAIADYMGVDPETVEPKYYRNRFFTAEQVVHCLRTLYSDPERFPGVIDCMLLAEPENYFCYHSQDYPIAHKYGYISEGGSLYVCDSGICYTDDPIIIVMFTEHARRPSALLADYCTLMCNYAESTRRIRLSQEEPQNESTIPAAENEDSPLVPVSVAPTYTDSQTTIEVESRSIMPIIAISIIGLALIITIIISMIKIKIKPISGVLSAFLVAVAFALCITGSVRGPVYTKTEGNPCDVITSFFDSIISGNYSSACDNLAEYSDIGLDVKPDDVVSAKMIDALRTSYDYELVGDCIINGLSASQKVRIRYLDLSKMSSDLQQNTNETIRLMVDSHLKNEIYDEDGNYRNDFISEAYSEAVDIALSHKNDYYSYSMIDIDMSYKSNHWLIYSSPELFAALCGGA